MHNTQLNGGEIRNFVPIGLDGTPVYMNALGFRDAIERTASLGTRYARFLAIPHFNGDFSHVDWYVPFESSSPDGEHRVVSWQAALPEERQQALKELSSFETALNKAGFELLSMSSTGDARLFAHYLTGVNSAEKLPAIHFPGPEYLYIVDGQPVITFWGFLKPGQKMGLSPFSMLYPHEKTVLKAHDKVEVHEAAPAQKKGHHCILPVWLRWLLGLLLLLLLLTFLLWLLSRLFNFRLPFPGFNGPDINAELNLPDADLKGPDLSLPDVDLKGPDLSLPDADLQGPDLSLPDVDLGGDLDLSLPDADLPTVDLPAFDFNGDGVIDEEDSRLEAEGAVPAEEAEGVAPLQPEEMGSGTEPPEESVPEEPVLPPSLAEETSDPAAEAVTEPASEAVESTTEDSQATEEAAATHTQPLILSQEALARGDVSALKGTWQTRSGMMDSTTGRPLNLSYRYENGKGELIVQRQDGTRCVTSANPQVINGNLEIVASGNAVCPDRKAYQLPKIRCVPNALGSADCEASYEGQAQFPLRMYGGEGR